MARAAFCSQCNANVYVTDDGRCPQGHGPESLSNFYEVTEEPSIAPSPAPVDQPPAYTPKPSPAAAAYADASPVGAKPKSKLPIIIAIVVGLLLLCGIGSCVAIGMFMNVAETSVTDLETAIDEEIAALEDEVVIDDSVDGQLADLAAADTQRMVQHFYPWFDLETHYTVGEPDASGASVFHVIAYYKNNPDFYLTFFATRTTEANPAGSDVEGQAYFDSEANVWWLHPETRTHALDSVFGPSPLMVESMLDQISADFVSAHPGKLVSDITALTNMDLGFAGIDESEIDDWYDDGESFTSTWVNDIAASPSRWKEVDYSEF